MFNNIVLLTSEKKLVNQMQLAHSRIKQAQINHFMNRLGSLNQKRNKLK